MSESPTERVERLLDEVKRARPRARGTNPRAMGTNPRAVEAKLMRNPPWRRALGGAEYEDPADVFPARPYNRALDWPKPDPATAEHHIVRSKGRPNT